MSYQKDRESSRHAAELMNAEKLKCILLEDTQAAIVELDTTAESIGKALAQLKFTTSQIRAVFGKVRSIEQIKTIDEDAANQKDEVVSTTISQRASTELRLLRPKLAYQYGRAGGTDKAFGQEKDMQKVGIGILQIILSDAIVVVGNDRAAFDRFINFFEAILAYHRASGGRN